MDQQEYDLLILYASQTGNAKYVSEELQRNLNILDYKTQLYSMDEYQIENLPEEKYIIFIVSTTGQGEPPSSMIDFWKFLLIQDLPSDSLENVKFTLFGLGDSQYIQYNAMARKLYQRLLQLGAQAFLERHLGDDQHPFGYDYELDIFTQQLYENLKYQINEIFQYIKAPPQSLNNNPIISRIKDMRLLTNPDYQRQTYRIDFEIEQEKNQIKYNPGDILMIYPFNTEENALKLLSLLHIYPHQIIKIKKNSKNKTFLKNIPFPPYLTVFQLFTYFLAIQHPPSRYFFKLMSLCTEDELHKEKLQELYESSEEYYSYVAKEKRNVYEILFDFNTVKMPLEYILESVQLQKFREFSISSTQLTNQNSVGITIGIVQYQTPFKRQIQGTCSIFLQQNPQQVVLFLKKVHFYFLLMIFQFLLLWQDLELVLHLLLDLLNIEINKLNKIKLKEKSFKIKLSLFLDVDMNQKNFIIENIQKKCNKKKKLNFSQPSQGIKRVIKFMFNIFWCKILKFLGKLQQKIQIKLKFLQVELPNLCQKMSKKAFVNFQINIQIMIMDKIQFLN
ncbi:nadph dependent diflavin oxidoreductase 1, putative [Ichthyophthirius multifiliis]|uniref:Nadph dependent diflavin oxidoreductase 1, putative n=1 Tax=Ichthyophthirius multifiliis TaxID=5932 RepID=G0QUE3_ICHMU|nr:nadph dependent diflavin oxidoreductase 1, putative [Ichthyophthirius multifiliis]EGR31163.1 nadph dependent diflavin oxidoreductase 1, putative [Ichthyophthirius multifiliis]|eukprot:XP_004034649.1 nadph dependent diflavin oxidoreductase 1, putative [Ichthyophthirius multifiliis]